MSADAIDAFVSRVRQERYTGPNRCWPCTLLNCVLLVGLTVLASVAFTPFVGLVVLLGGLFGIALRGYLVPYTPQLTHSFLVAVPGRRAPTDALPPSHDHGAGDDVADGTAASDIVDELLAAGVLTEDDRGLSLDPAFHDRWRSEMVDARSKGRDDLAAALRTAVPWVADASVVTDDGRHWVVLSDEEDRIEAETWLSPPAAVADLAALRTLADRTEFSPDERTLAAPPLRQFLERCPACDETLELSSPNACCGSPRGVARGIESILSCPACDEAVTVFRTPDGDRP